MKDNCPRDAFGFCMIALAAHPDCLGSDECRVRDHDKAWREVIDAALTAEPAKQEDR